MTDEAIDIKANTVNFNSIGMGIIEACVFYFIFLAVDEMLLREYMIKNPNELYSDILSVFALGFFPFINLIFRKYRALLGNVIGIPVFAVIATVIAVIFFGYKG